jgi:hypothetical protein
MTSFAVRHIGGRVFIERTKPSPKAPDPAMARACVGELREFDPETGHIGTKLHGEAQAEVDALRDLYAQGYRAHEVRNGWTVVRSRDGYESGKMIDARRAWAMALKDYRFRASREANPESEYVKAGAEACRAGVPWWNNPHESGSAKAYEWDAGHTRERLAVAT